MLFGAILMAALAAAPPAVPPEAAASDEKFERELVEGVPAPLRFGRLAPVVGRSVEFQVSAPKSKARVLAALTRRVEKESRVRLAGAADLLLKHHLAHFFVQHVNSVR